MGILEKFTLDSTWEALYFRCLAYASASKNGPMKGPYGKYVTENPAHKSANL
jgi:hypothetical protein